MPYSKYLGLPHARKWGEVDYWLSQGLDCLDERLCHCGSGLWRDDCVNPAHQSLLVVEEETHFGLAAIEDYRSQHEDLPAGTALRVRLPSLEEGRLSPEERARREIAEMKARHGLK